MAVLRNLSRRHALRASLFGGVGLLTAACAPAASPQPPRPTSAPQPSSVPPTAVPPAAGATTVIATAMPAQAATAASTISATTAPAAAAVSAAGLLNTSVAAAAKQFLDGLSDAQRSQASFGLRDAERVRWHWTNTGAFPRNGVMLGKLSAPQREAALALLRASLSENGFKKTTDIMSLQSEISGDPANYFVSLFGKPGDATWGWRFEGHHVSRHFTLQGEKMSISPFFHGVWPSASAAGKVIMNREEFAARELMKSLSPALHGQVLYSAEAPGQHETWNTVSIKPLAPVGAPLAALSTDQRALVNEILQAWLATQAEPVAKTQLARINASKPEDVRFGWAGSQEERRPHYYRIQGPTFLLEHDNSRNGATHIHSVFRVFDEDFGQGLI